MEEVYDLIVIGGGPFGIASIVEAQYDGFKKILLLEKGESHSQTIRQFYKDGKRVDKEYKGLASETLGSVVFFDGTKETTLNYFEALLKSRKIEAIFKAEVERVQKVGDIFELKTSKGDFKAKYVLIGIGIMGKPNKPSYPIPSSLNKIVNFNINSCQKDEKILVVGGGNSAAEYAVSLCENNQVTMCYRKASFSRLNDINLRDVLAKSQAKKIELKLACDILSLENENGKAKVNFNTNQSEVFDRIIYAIGGSTPVDFLAKCDLSLDNGKIKLDEHNQTHIKGLFIGGDIANNKGGSIVVALNDAHKIISYLKQKEQS